MEVESTSARLRQLSAKIKKRRIEEEIEAVQEEKSKKGRAEQSSHWQIDFSSATRQFLACFSSWCLS